MDSNSFEALLNGAKKTFEDKIEAERKAEEQRIENARIVKLAQERYDQLLPYYNFWEPELKTYNLGSIPEFEFNNILASLKQEKVDYDEKQEQVRLENERLKREKEEADRILAEARKRQMEERKLAEEKLRKEQQENKRLQEEAAAKVRKEAEEKAQEVARIEAEKEAELSKGDKAKFADLISDLNTLKTKYEFKGKKYKNLQGYINELLDQIISYAESKI